MEEDYGQERISEKHERTKELEANRETILKLTNYVQKL